MGHCFLILCAEACTIPFVMFEHIFVQVLLYRPVHNLYIELKKGELFKYSSNRNSAVVFIYLIHFYQILSCLDSIIPTYHCRMTESFSGIISQRQTKYLHHASNRDYGLHSQLFAKRSSYAQSLFSCSSSPVVPRRTTPFNPLDFLHWPLLQTPSMLPN